LVQPQERRKGRHQEAVICDEASGGAMGIDMGCNSVLVWLERGCVRAKGASRSNVADPGGLEL